MTKDEVFQQVREIGIIPAVRACSAISAVRAATAIAKGGIPIVEISMAMPNSAATLEAVVVECPETLVGAGTIMDGEGVRLAKRCGAQFIVTPGFDLNAVRVAQEYDLTIFVGALTPTEVQVATASGADAVKIFPCYSVGGAPYLKSLRGQYPDTAFIASGGIGLENCAAYIRTGACAIGVGGEIADADTMNSGDYRVFTVRSQRLRKAVAEAQALRKPVPTLV